MKRKMKWLVLFIVPFLVFTACNKDDDENDNANMKDSITLNFRNLAPSAEDEKYEGWVVTDGMSVTSGKFDMVDMADKCAPFSGSDGSDPPFPGEDFVMDAPDGLSFPTDLSGGKVVVSIEPDPDNSPKPFAFKPLVGDVPMDATDHTVYGMISYVSKSFPTGMAMKE